MFKHVNKTCIQVIYLHLCLSSASGQISSLALETFDALAVSSSPVTAILFPTDYAPWGNFSGHFQIPVTVWNCGAVPACYVEFTRYITQGDVSFPRPGVVLAPFHGSRYPTALTFTVKTFEKYHSNIQWIIAARQQKVALRAFDGHVCQVITVSETEINLPSDGYRQCAKRQVVTTIRDGQLKEAIPAAGTYTKNQVLRYATKDESSDVCFRSIAIVRLLRELYGALNNTLVEDCNQGDTDSLLLDRRVDFTIAMPDRPHPRSYYAYAHMANSLCFLSRRNGPVAPSFTSTWMSFFTLLVVLAPLAAVATLALSFRPRQSHTGAPNRSELTLFYLSSYLGRCPPPVRESNSSSVRITLLAWMFGMFFLVQFTQTAITASRNVPGDSPQMRTISELVSRLDDGSVTPCMHFTIAGVITSLGGDTPHLLSLRLAMHKCGRACLSAFFADECISRALKGTHVVVDICRIYLENNGNSPGIVVGDESLLTYITVQPMHARYPRRHQHRRLLLMLEESGLNKHVLKNVYRPCAECGVVVSFDMPFKSYLLVFVTGCCSSLVVFCLETAHKRYSVKAQQGQLFADSQLCTGK